jgi:hypothetical protein
MGCFHLELWSISPVGGKWFYNILRCLQLTDDVKAISKDVSVVGSPGDLHGFDGVPREGWRLD